VVGVSMFIAGLAMILIPQRKAPTR
jgi:hypothetical protein